MPFDVEALLAKPVSGTMSTERIVVPEGVYTAISGTKIKIRTPKESVILELPWEIDSPEVAKETGRDKSTCYQNIFLDIDHSGDLDLGRGMNSDLGSLREALGQLNADQPWTFAELSGQAASITIKHDLYEGVTRAKVVKVEALT